MAKIRSLGLHEPSALPYLIDEGLLPHNADASSYVWSQSVRPSAHDSHVIEEILRTEQCVVWSRDGTIKQVFNLDIENESIVNAFTTTFASSPTYSELAEESDVAGEDSHAALIIILKTQAHIFVIRGDTYVLPLPFDVSVVCPSPRGFLFQRSPSNSHSRFNNVGRKGNVDQDSFLSARDVSAEALESTFPYHEAVSQNFNGPTTYCLIDPLSDIGLVVASPSRKIIDVKECFILPREERVIYVSPSPEIPGQVYFGIEPVYLAVTLNTTNDNLTVWRLIFDNARAHDRRHSTSDDHPIHDFRKRQSSNVYERQSARGTSSHALLSSSRDGIEGLMQSFIGSNKKPHESHSSKLEDLAAELGHDFEFSGVQTRSARRISSMLARTELGAPTERSVFVEQSLGPSSRKSMSRTARQEGSFGSVTDRRSLGQGRHSSFTMPLSAVSNGTSVLDPPIRLSIGDSGAFSSDNAGGDSIEGDHMSRDMVFVKLRTFPRQARSSNCVPRVMTLPSQATISLDEISFRLSVCLFELEAEQLSVVSLAAKTKIAKAEATKRSRRQKCDVKAVELQHGDAISDVCVVADPPEARILTLTKTSNHSTAIHLEAPGATPFRLDLPTTFWLSHQWRAPKYGGRRGSMHGKTKRTITIDAENLRFVTSQNRRTLVIADSMERMHQLSVSLQPGDAFIQRIVQICEFVLPAAVPGSIIATYWEVQRWLADQEVTTDLEWTALTIMLFSLALPSISVLQERPISAPRRKQNSTLRSSSGGQTGSFHWDQMLSSKEHGRYRSSARRTCWHWTEKKDTSLCTPTTSPNKNTRTMFTAPQQTAVPDQFLKHHINLAREFLQSPAGEQVVGPEGQFPVAIGQDRDLRRAALATVVVALQLLQQELKLDQALMSGLHLREKHFLIIILQLASWLGWPSWVSQSQSQLIAEHDLHALDLETSVIDLLDVPSEPFPPQSVFRLVEAGLHRESFSYRTLVDLVLQSKDLKSDHPLELAAAQLLPFTTFLLTLLKNGHHNTMWQRLGSSILRKALSVLRLVDGINICMRHMIVPTADSGMPAGLFPRKGSANTKVPLNSRANHIALRDSRYICDTVLDSEGLPRWDVSSETDRQNITKMLYHQDRRFQEASRLVNQTRPPEIAFAPEAGWTEAEELEAQKQIAQHVARRTLSVASGRAIMHYNARMPLLTERVPIPAFSLQCIMRPKTESENQQSLTVSADKALFSEDKVCWAFFHNGASAGLMISKDASWIDTSWILYNKPVELTNRHAGFLLALGLNGHLKSLAKWVAFKYLTPKHTMTSIGLLLGLAASYLGTSDTLITRLLSVHVTCLLPPGAAELNLSPLTQTTGIMGIGLLYYNSQHRRMSEVMLSEIEHKGEEDRSGEEAVIRDEGYRLAAGIALGLINLGQGVRLHALHDMRVVERLLTIAVGTKNVNLVHVLDRATAGAVIAVAFIFMKTNDASTARKVDVPDTVHQFDYVRPDIFLLRSLARHLIMWDNIKPNPSFIQQSLPDHCQQRFDLKAVKSLHTTDLPCYYILTGICFAIALKFAGTQLIEARDLLISYLDQFLRLSKMSAMNYDAKVTLSGIRNCLDLLALSSATIMAGSGDVLVMRRLRALHGRIDKDIPFGSHLASHMALGVLFLSGGTATFGTSKLAVASLIIAFYPLFPTDVLDNRGHLQALRHLWVLAVEPRCLVVRDADDGRVIGNLTAQVTDVTGSIQHVRVPSLLAEYQRIKIIQISADDYWSVKVDLDSCFDKGKKQNAKTWTVRDELSKQARGVNVFLRRRDLYDRPSSDIFWSDLGALDQSHGVPSVNPNAAVNEKWRSTASSLKGRHPLAWMFELDAFSGLDYAEQALVLNEYESEDGGHSLYDDQVSFLKGTIVDTRLEFDHGTLGPSEITRSSHIDGKRELVKRREIDHDKLWQLRLLLAWTNRLEKQEPQGSDTDTEMDDVVFRKAIGQSEVYGQSLRSEFIEQMRSRLWEMSIEEAEKE